MTRGGRFRLREARRRGSDFELVYEVTAAGGSREATVRVGRSGRCAFPHIASSTGETLGSDADDATLLDNAQRVVALLEAAGEWLAFSRGRRPG